MFFQYEACLPVKIHQLFKLQGSKRRKKVGAYGLEISVPKLLSDVSLC